MSASQNPAEAQLDAALERIMNMSEEEMAASEGMTLEEARVEWGKRRDRILEKIRRQCPDFGKKRS